MCGLTGFIAAGNGPELEQRCREMVATLHHRGPDDQGVWVDTAAGIALGHARLSIVDLSPAGHQPMQSADGRWVMVYNGEVYNVDELRRDLTAAGCRFRGHADTEVILEACAAWGVAETLERLIGMFALALWDRQERCLYLARDRLGIKPLYWGQQPGGLFLFGSELKALRAHPGWRPEIDRDALVAYLRHNYIPAPRSIYQGIGKLPPAHLLRLGADGVPRLACYWNLRELASRASRDPDEMSDAEAVEALDGLLRDAVGRRMVADVPLGGLLSGGIDSATVVALMQAQSSRPVKTFSIGFHVPGYDEAVHAKAVARHLGTDHTELYVEPGHALEILPRLSEWYDEPFADSSQIPTYLVSEMTRRSVTVALSGDGGDELFAGYNRYFWATGLWRRISWMPAPLRQGMAGLIRMLPPSAWERLFGLLPAGLAPSRPGEKLVKLAQILALKSPDAIYRRLVSQFTNGEAIVAGGHEPATALWDESLIETFPDFTQRMQYLDSVMYLPDDILTKVDRASMAVSLEARVPLLDHRVVEFSWAQPMHNKIRGGQGKWLLRQVLNRYVPRELFERPKMGFGVPIGDWLRGELRDWARELLDPERLRQQGYLDPDTVTTCLGEHLSGKRDWQYPLWTLLMFQAWLERWM